MKDGDIYVPVEETLERATGVQKGSWSIRYGSWRIGGRSARRSSGQPTARHFDSARFVD
jgi:hypothetical protein